MLALQAHAQHMGVLRADGHDERHAQHHAGGEGGEGGEGEGHIGFLRWMPIPLTGASVMAGSLPADGNLFNHFNTK